MGFFSRAGQPKKLIPIKKINLNLKYSSKN